MQKKKKNLPVSANNPGPDNRGHIIESHQTRIHSGPLPSPDVLREYDTIIAGAANRIICMAEKQQEHRQNLETIVVKGDSRRAFCGLWAGVFVVVRILAASVYVVTLGYQIAGTILGALDLAGLVSVFVYGTVTRRRERAQKAELMSQSRR